MIKFKHISIAVLLSLGVFTVSAQNSTNNSTILSVGSSLVSPLTNIVNQFKADTNALAATNWTVAPYYSHANSLKNKNGGGLAAVYYLNQYVGTQIRFQYLNTGDGAGLANVWLPNGTITLNTTYQPFHGLPLTLRPVLEAGVAANLNGTMYAIAGAGSEVDIYTAKDPSSTIQRFSFFYGVEQWQGQNQKFGVQQFGGALILNTEALTRWLHNHLP